VAYDTFVGTSPNGANTFEVMIWLGLYGTISPLSANGYPFKPIATPTIGGTAFDLAYGLNGNVKVYSFVAHSRAANSFSGNIVSDHAPDMSNNLTSVKLDFYKYLESNYSSNGFTSSLYLQSIQAGTEIFTGSNAKLTTSAYTISVS
jgi:xyloglucan-specific endo-beta-1,4-glucanase